MGILWGRSSSLEWDNNGVLAEGALASFYEAGTSTPKAVYQDGGESTAHEFPVEADDGRWPAVFIPFGSYKVVIKTAGGTTLFSADNIPNPAPVSPEQSVDETQLIQTGFIELGLGNETRTGFVRLNGRSIGSAASGANERAHADTVAVYTFIYNRCSDTAAPVSGGRGANAAADFAADKRLTTPNYCSAVLVGFPDMGGTDNTLLNGVPVVLGSTTTPGSLLGANTHTLTLAQVPNHAHTVSLTTGAGSAHTHGVSGNTGAEAAHTHTGTTGAESADHTHGYNTANNKAGTAVGGFASVGGTIWNGIDTAATSGGTSATHTHSFTSSAGSSHLHAISLTSGSESSHTHSVGGETLTVGGSEAHNNLSRAAVVTFYIKL